MKTIEDCFAVIDEMRHDEALWNNVKEFCIHEREKAENKEIMAMGVMHVVYGISSIIAGIKNARK